MNTYQGGMESDIWRDNLEIEKQRRRFSRLKERLGIRLNDEDLKMLILEAQKDEGVINFTIVNASARIEQLL